MKQQKSKHIPCDAGAVQDWSSINRDYLADEASVVERLLPLARPQPGLKEKIEDTARSLAESVRARQHNSSGLHAFLNHYDLSSHEGVVLMCLAEALLRIPDAGTMDALIADKLNSGDWEQHLGKDSSLFVNASTWGLMLTGKLLYHGQEDTPVLPDLMRKLLSRLEQPVLRAALKAAMKIMADEFVLGRNIDEAIRRSRTTALRRYRFSYDMLGEAALTNNTADRYEQAYAQAIETLGRAAGSGVRSADRPGISVKLSSLCPRFEPNQPARAIRELTTRMVRLCTAARDAGIALTIDAEETERLEMSIRVFERLLHHNGLRAWPGLGLAVQAYQKRALPLLEYLHQLAAERDRVIPVRLVKGAYWDMEIKRAQEQGLADYPVFTLKRNTDLSYLACARYLLLIACAFIRSSPPITPTPSAISIIMPGSGSSNSSGCTAWVRNCMPALLVRRDSTFPAACMHRWARTRTCCPTWCAGCWKTAPTCPLSTALPTGRFPSPNWLRTRWTPSSRTTGTSGIPAYRYRRTCSGRTEEFPRLQFCRPRRPGGIA